MSVTRSRYSFSESFLKPAVSSSGTAPQETVPGSGQNWMEVAYGTRAGKVRVVVRHPENIGQAPQIFQTYSVHTCPIMRVVLGEKHLKYIDIEQYTLRGVVRVEVASAHYMVPEAFWSMQNSPPHGKT